MLLNTKTSDVKKRDNKKIDYDRLAYELEDDRTRYYEQFLKQKLFINRSN